MPNEKHVSSPTSKELSTSYQTDELQYCFIGHSHHARWRDDLVSACEEIMPKFGVVPWYADKYLDPTKSLLDTIVDMVAHAHLGIYDLSCWHEGKQGTWAIPRNVLIELGIAIALNRPILLIQHEESRRNGPKLPDCLESLRERILPFTGPYHLKEILAENVPVLLKGPPDSNWLGRHCHFGNQVCKYREIHPFQRQWRHEKLHCHIADGSDIDQSDFRGLIEEVLNQYNDVEVHYLDELSIADGYKYFICSYCQMVRTTLFAIYRITPQTNIGTYIAMGISIAIERQFDYKIPKILLTATMEDVPSLLTMNKVVVAWNSTESKRRLQEFLPQVLQVVRRTTFRPRPLPFIEFKPRIRTPVPKERGTENDQTAIVDQTSGLLQQIQKLFAQGRLSEAISLCEQSLAKDTNQPTIRFFLGRLFQQQQLWMKATRQFQHLLDDSTYALSSYQALGQCYRGRGDMRTAARYFDEALKRVDFRAFGISESDQLMQMYYEVAEAHNIVGEQQVVMDIYNTLMGFLQEHGLSDKVTQVDQCFNKYRVTRLPSRFLPLERIRAYHRIDKRCRLLGKHRNHLRYKRREVQVFCVLKRGENLDVLMRYETGT